MYIYCILQSSNWQLSKQIQDLTTMDFEQFKLRLTSQLNSLLITPGTQKNIPGSLTLKGDNAFIKADTIYVGETDIKKLAKKVEFKHLKQNIDLGHLS